MQIDLKRFHAAFFDEATEHLATLEECLLSLERAPADTEQLNRIFRAAHSIKGASGTFGFGDIAAFTHSLEGLLDRMRSGDILPTPELVELLLRSSDALGGLVSAAKDGGPLPESIESLIQALEAARGGSGTGQAAPPAMPPTPTRETATQEYRVRFQPGRDLLHFGMDPLLLLRELAEIGTISEVTADTSQLPDLLALVPDECYIGWTMRLSSAKSLDEIQAVFVFVEDCSQISIEAVPAIDGQAGLPAPSTKPVATAEATARMAPAGPLPPTKEHKDAAAPSRPRSLESSSIRVSVEKVDELINLVGELVIAQSMVNQVVGRIPADILPGMQEALGIMDRSTRDLQERVMAVRMVPLANVFQRFPRLVRDLAGSLGKQINVEISGEDTELDKQMIEQIADPLTHMIRNAVDHGIGTPEERQRAGKPPQGTIGLRGYQEGGNVVIEVSDDGHGLDLERLRRKAIGLGLIGADDQLSDSQLRELILAPGFSTAEKVTDISGRGVGMDVVKRNVEALNGSVSIESTLGRGTTFRVRLPLTMAIVDGLAAGINGEIYIFPTLSVLESFRPQAAEVKSIAGRGEVVLVRGRPVPLVRLYRIFHRPAKCTEPTQGLVVIVEHQGKNFGLLVDELLGQTQVVMKSFESNYEKVEGISAATILGDGQVAFILDVPGLSRMARRGT
jgi:two-component system chemotaxis sensor kinase CheA